MKTPLNMLFVEDSEDDARLVVEELRRGGFEPSWKRTETEEDFRAGLSAALDVIICDYTLPCFSGPAAIRTLCKSGLDVPLIVVSGAVGEETAVECMKAGASDYLVKDRLGRLGSAVRRVVEERRLRREKEYTERSLREAQKRLERVASTSPTVSYLLEIRGNTFLPVWVGDNVVGLTGFDAVEALRPDWWSNQINPEDHDQVVKEMARLFEKGRLVQEYQFRRKDGSLFWMRDEQRLLHNESGVPVEIVGSWSDITERKSLEAQLWQAQKMESIGRLAAGVAHDFNNMLAVIQGNASLLLMAGNLKEDKSADYAHQICLATERAATLVRQLLTFSRKQVMQPQHVQMNEIIGNLKKMLERMLNEDVALHVNSTPGLPMIHADVGMMEQVLMNLAVNSRDAMPGGGRLVIETAAVVIDKAYQELNPGTPTGDYICVSVSDTGCGIPQENLSRIFEPFFTTKEVGKGTGLGLATVYGIVRQHGGWIKVYSETNQGTVFRIYLPVSTAAEKKPEDSVTERPICGGHETILLVEDEPQLRALVRNILERYGYRVLEADSGQAALDVWGEHAGKIDLLLTDMVMPGGLTGKELAERLRVASPSLNVIYSSAYSAEVVGKDFSLIEGIDFLQKPYNPRLLAQSVRDSLDRDTVGACGSQ